MEISFYHLIFKVEDERVLLNNRSFVEIQICGEN